MERQRIDQHFVGSRAGGSTKFAGVGETSCGALHDAVKNRLMAAEKILSSLDSRTTTPWPASASVP